MIRVQMFDEQPDPDPHGECAAHIHRLEGINDELLAALRALEVSANTVAYCYEKHPGNFAAALRDMDHFAESARTAIAKATTA